VNDPDPVELFHQCTGHGERPREPDQLVRFRSLDPANRPAPFKRYPDLELEMLPRDLLASGLAAVDVLSGSRGESAGLDRRLLGTLLFLAAGVSRVRGSPVPSALYRTAMSAGNLHPVEVYVLDGGLWHYQPLEHALVQLRPPAETGPGGDSAALVLTGIPFRTCWKYRERGWRHLFWDAGTTVANVLAVAAAHGVECQVELGFDDVAVAQLAGLDPAEEMPLALVHLGPASVPIPPSGSLPPLVVRTEPIAPHPLRFPLLEQAHAAGVLPDSEVKTWRRSIASLAATASPTAAPAPDGNGSTIEEVILRRGSTRSFLHTDASDALLSWAIAASTLAEPSDVGSGSVIEHFVSVHAVEGHPPGQTAWDPDRGLVQLGGAGEAEEREAAQHLCLDQPLGGDSAFTVFHSCELGTLFRNGGARGYRVAQFQAGVASGRLALCAFALGAGATGLTFFDRLVSQHFGTEAAPMLVTAVGHPTHPPAPAGSPGHPAVLHRRKDL
jgi:SagB-type dehydrogenase family enzyme